MSSVSFTLSFFQSLKKKKKKKPKSPCFHLFLPKPRTVPSIASFWIPWKCSVWFTAMLSWAWVHLSPCEPQLAGQSQAKRTMIQSVTSYLPRTNGCSFIWVDLYSTSISTEQSPIPLITVCGDAAEMYSGKEMKTNLSKTNENYLIPSLKWKG
jgi:hypothetical protein